MSIRRSSPSPKIRAAYSKKDVDARVEPGHDD